MAPFLREEFPLTPHLFENALFVLRSYKCCAWESLLKDRTASHFENSHHQQHCSVLAVFDSSISLYQDKLLTLSGDHETLESLDNQCPFSLLDAISKQQLDQLPGGIFGFFSYDCARMVEQIKGIEVHPQHPDAHFIFPTLSLNCNYSENTVTLCYTSEAPEKAVLSLRNLLTQTEHSAITRSPSSIVDLVVAQDKSAKDFENMVRTAQEYILAGDCFQIVLSNSFEVGATIDPLVTYLHLRNNNPSAYHFLIPFSDSTLVGASPETMLRSQKLSQGIEIAMRPVAGTYPLKDQLHDQPELAKQLSQDPKEHAEHLMLVDHARNDIGRSAKLTSVCVKELLAVETYEHLHHLVSDVRGILRDDISVIGALKNAFPIATLAGTPKIRAMEIIAELEQKPRGIFGGAVFFLNNAMDLDSAVAIRSMVIGKNKVSFQAGAGIVVDSNPTKEHQECLLKTSSQINAIKDVQ